MSKKNAKQDRVVEILEENIQVRTERNDSYGEETFGGCYKQHGHVQSMLFPDGFTIHDAHNMSRMGCLNMIIGKLVRYCNQFENGGHADSLSDIQVYAAMLQELDELGEE